VVVVVLAKTHQELAVLEAEEAVEEFLAEHLLNLVL
jgi:hypothetical protein